ncbi:MAG: hypothetical protein Q8N22_02145 [bacterium]|nr:hypothetical protein [bacterium]
MENQFEEKKEIPGPPPSKVSVRTMQSDINSIQESGGQAPQPYTTELGQGQKKETSAPEEISFQPAELESNISGYTGPEEPIFQPGAIISPLPPKQKPAQAEIGNKPKKKTSKVLITSIILILAAITAGAIYYFINKKQIAAPALTPPVIPPVAVAPALTPAPQYVSLLKTTSTLQEEKIVSILTLDNIKNALTDAASTTQANNLKEVILRNPDQSLVAFYKFIPVLLPEIKSEDIAAIFQENFTAMVFVDQNGVWPGYVAQLTSSSTLFQSQTSMKQNLEASASLQNIFLENTSPIVAVFKDGKAGNPTINTRYLVFPKTGAAINYGWVNDKLVISTSYAGLVEILKKLQ